MILLAWKQQLKFSRNKVESKEIVIRFNFNTKYNNGKINSNITARSKKSDTNE